MRTGCGQWWCDLRTSWLRHFQQLGHKVGGRECRTAARAQGGKGTRLRPAQRPATAPPPGRKAGERREAESGGGRRAERLFVVRFDPKGEPETLTFLA